MKRTPKRSLAQRQRVYKQPPKHQDKCCLCGGVPVYQTDGGDRLCVKHLARLEQVIAMAHNRRDGYMVRA